MRHISFPEYIDTFNRRLPFFLATEEWVARNLPADDYFFSWQVNPTVICGRNQEISKEVNLAYCKDNKIDVVRRRSGGGAVFADRENFMFSYITPGDDVTTTFAHYTSMIADALCKLGINAVATGRNDITINDKKVSGNAFYHIPGRCIAHGTMLYHFDPSHIANALTPSKAKLESKGVKSVQSRVTCLQEEGISLSPVQFEKYMIESITDSNPYIISEDDLKEIIAIENTYYDKSFINIPDDSSICDNDETLSNRVSNHMRLEGVGEFYIDYTITPGNIINDFRISGDFFMNEDTDHLICDRINGTPFLEKAIKEVVSEIKPCKIIPGLTEESLAQLIFSK